MILSWLDFIRLLIDKLKAVDVYMLYNINLFHISNLNLKSQGLEVGVNYIAPLFFLAPWQGVRFAGSLTSN